MIYSQSLHKFYFRLSGGSPFLGETRDETFVNISAVNYHFSERYFEHISPYAKDFISHLFVRDQRKRATVDECLRHPWIRGVCFLLRLKDLSNFTENILRNLFSNCL